MEWLEIIQRLLLASFISGAIGFDREFKNRPAGIRTHILVCVGATIVALIQYQISTEALETALATPELASVVKSDPTRLVAQVISGIGFLGAGTIIVTKRSVLGLTTAASLWASACLGVAIGLGMYRIAILGFITIQVVLSLLNKILVVSTIKKLEVKYIHRVATKEFILDYFVDNHVLVKDVNFDVTLTEEGRIYTNIYTIELPRGKNYADLIEDLSLNKNVMQIRLIDV
ncbi:MgtC/SapB family protein [Vagococcus intermedius]|uniref:MgtC/SapB family protein n=1 Tax=Vagococcus intermedius TaxID=2991418 RepID=A0AAF0CTY1_9ENTE|nr:MgtC/SapB family protein [Vagococcus intermedius]WEG72920.1 MgtC/SapB family protein [Vagococcus intermedius]WEG75007.1 MgtC/SapB family protein [Vagococcus intermedius]